MSEQLLLKIITSNSVIEQDADLVILPGEEGELGILPLHSPLVASIKMGIIKVDFENKIMKYFIMPAIANINSYLVEVITDFVIDLAETNKAEVTEMIARLEDQITTAKNHNKDYSPLEHELSIWQEVLNVLHKVMTYIMNLN